jgi:hypothetical protein
VDKLGIKMKTNQKIKKLKASTTLNQMKKISHTLLKALHKKLKVKAMMK